MSKNTKLAVVINRALGFIRAENSDYLDKKFALCAIHDATRHAVKRDEMVALNNAITAADRGDWAEADSILDLMLGNIATKKLGAGWTAKPNTSGTWSGTQHAHVKGFVNVADEDGTTEVYVLSKNQTYHWSAKLDSLTPKTLIDAAIATAKAYVENLK